MEIFAYFNQRLYFKITGASPMYYMIEIFDLDSEYIYIFFTNNKPIVISLLRKGV